MTEFVSKDTINRLLKDVKQIMKSPLDENGIYYVHDDVDMMKGYAMIVGSADTPYFGGYYFFELKFPTDYPHSPPSVTYWTNGDNIRFNPNLYKCGKVCVSLLNTWRGDQWTSCQTISTVLLTLCTLLCKDPLLNEPGVTTSHADFKNYTEIIEYVNIKIAICNIINKTPVYYVKFFDKFYPIVVEHFLKNYEPLLEIISKKCDKPKKIKTGFYSMSVDINYHTLLEKFTKCKVDLIHF
jgi:ubiquitin-conjugating enzyme E2 Z